MEVAVLNSGDDDALEPEIRIVPRFKFDSKKSPISGLFVLRKGAVMLDYQLVRTQSNDPQEPELAGVFLNDGLRRVPLVAGSTSVKFVFGFAFKDGNSFHMASEDVLTFLSLPFTKEPLQLEFEIFAKAKNSSNSLICERAALVFPSYNELKLTPLKGVKSSIKEFRKTGG